MTDHAGPAAAFARRIEKERRLKGWNLGDLAKRAGVGRNTLSLMSENPGLPLPRTVIALADAVGLNREEALRLVGYDDAPAAIPTPEQVAKQETRPTLADALRRRLPDLDDATLARVALAMADVLQGAANELFDASEEDT